MPHIRQEGDYPENWKEITDACKLEAGHKCEWCGIDGEKHNGNGRQLSVHHLNGNPSDCDRSNLAVLCARCHLSDQHRVFYLLRIQRMEAMGQMNIFQGNKRRDDG